MDFGISRDGENTSLQDLMQATWFEAVGNLQPYVRYLSRADQTHASVDFWSERGARKNRGAEAPRLKVSPSRLNL
jgi:hypothetical protein